MAPAPDGDPGGASAGPGRKGTPPGPRLGLAGHGPQDSDAGSGNVGCAAGTGTAGPRGARGAGRWARGARPLPAARAPIAHPAMPRPRLSRSPAREAGGAEPGAGPPCERPRAGLGLCAPRRQPGPAWAPPPAPTSGTRRQGRTSLVCLPPAPVHDVTQQTHHSHTHTWTGGHTILPSPTGLPHNRAAVLRGVKVEALSLPEGPETPGLNPQ